MAKYFVARAIGGYWGSKYYKCYSTKRFQPPDGLVIGWDSNKPIWTGDDLTEGRKIAVAANKKRVKG